MLQLSIVVALGYFFKGFLRTVKEFIFLLFYVLKLNANKELKSSPIYKLWNCLTGESTAFNQFCLFMNFTSFLYRHFCI